MQSDPDREMVKDHLRLIERVELFCATNELRKLGDVKGKLIE